MLYYLSLDKFHMYVGGINEVIHPGALHLCSL